jgi:beta-lactamase superfamily II metal-dependent hydrolase
MEFAGSRLLFTADAGSEALDQIPEEWKNLAWMQVPHHGSDGNLSQKNIERFCPRFAFISACGDSSHPSRAIVNGLIKVGAQVSSTHSLNPGHLWFHIGSVPARSDYGEAVLLKATGDQKPLDWTALLLAGSR